MLPSYHRLFSITIKKVTRYRYSLHATIEPLCTEDKMIIDSHQHAYYHGLNPAGVIAEMDQFGIDVTWLLTWYHPPAEHAPGSCRAFNPCNIRPDGTHAGATLDEIAPSSGSIPRSLHRRILSRAPPREMLRHCLKPPITCTGCGSAENGAIACCWTIHAH